MTRLSTSLKKIALIAMTSAILGLSTAGTALAVDCGNINYVTNRFNNGPYDCNGTPTSECIYLTRVQACCPSSSPSQGAGSQEECMCSVYNTAPTVFNNTGITPAQAANCSNY